MLPHRQVVRPCLDLLILINLALSALETSSPLHKFSETGVPLQNSVSTEFRIAVSLALALLVLCVKLGKNTTIIPTININNPQHSLLARHSFDKLGS